MPAEAVAGRQLFLRDDRMSKSLRYAHRGEFINFTIRKQGQLHFKQANQERGPQTAPNRRTESQKRFPYRRTLQSQLDHQFSVDIDWPEPRPDQGQSRQR